MPERPFSVTPDLTIITVCYNSTAVLPAMLASVPAGVPVVLVDNASRDIGALREIASAHGAKLIESAENIGFGPANNLGATAASTEFLLLLNPDTVLEDDCLGALLQSAAAHPGATAFNPRLLDRKGGVTFRRRTKIDPSFTVNGPVPQTDTEIPTLLGSAIFVRRSAFDQIGGFDPDIFLYHEDDDLSLRLRQIGPLMLSAGATVTHLEGRSSARNPAVAGFKAFHMARSYVYTYAKHGHSFMRLRALGKALLGLVSPMMLSARKRAKNIGFFKGALSTLKDGGRGRG